jgi:hypothetical protein
MSHLYWDRVRTELAGTRQSCFAAKTTMTNVDPSTDTGGMLSPDLHHQLKPPDRGQADFGSADAQTSEATDALLDHIALALASGADPSS